jgi:hypothetical protein
MPNNDSHTLEPDRLQWFAGDRDALDLYERLVYAIHAWDDLVDQDKPVNVNDMVANLFLYIPQNPVFRRYEGELRALFMTGMVGYMAANAMEKSGNEHKLELAHYLRYTIINMGVFLITIFNGPARAAVILEEAAMTMIPERLADYVKEHSNADTH